MKKYTMCSLVELPALALAVASCYCTCALAQNEAPASAAAQPKADEETELAPVTVSAHEGVAVPYDSTGVSVSILDIPQLKKEGVYTLSEALTTVPGVYVLPGGGTYQRGNISKPVIRGLNSDKYVLPMIDGMRLNGLASLNGLVTSNVVARTPVFGLGALELVRGAEGAVYGSGAMGGVLYMETPEGKGEPGASLFNEYGSFDSYTGNFTAQGRVEDTAFYVSSTYEHSNNDIHYEDGSKPQMKHAGRYQNYSQAVRLDQYLNEKNKLVFTFRREDARYSDVTGQGLYAFRTNLLTVKYQGEITRKLTSGLMFGYYDEDKTLGAHGTNPYGETVYEMDNVQLEWRNLFKWNETNKTTAGVSWVRSDFDMLKGGQEVPSNSDLDSVISFFAEHSVEPVKGWTNTVAARLDQSSVYNALFTLRAATNYKFNRERTRLYASAGRGYAAPSAFERSNGSCYVPAWWCTYHGNPDLDCETNWSADFGAEQEWRKDHFVSATLFWAQTEDAIQAVDPVGTYTDYYYINKAGHQTFQGVEFAARGLLSAPWKIGYKFAWTITSPKDSSTDRQVADSARQVWSADVYTNPVEKLTTGLGLAAAVGRMDSSGQKRIDDYVVLRWYAHYEVNDHLSLSLRVENLTNQKFVTSSFNATPGTGIISPGTAVYGGCTIKF